MDLKEKRAHWGKKIDCIINEFVRAELGLMTIERWESKRDKFYDEVKAEMERCGDNHFLPKNIKRLIQIRGPYEQRLIERQEKGWEYVRKSAMMNEVKKVLTGLEFLSRIDRALDGPLGYEIRELEDGSGFVVDVPEV